MEIQLELKGMRFYSYHGLLKEERLTGGRYTVDLSWTVLAESAVRKDSLEDSVDYAKVYDVVKEQMLTPSNLIEHAAGRILGALHTSFPQMKRIEVAVEKMAPPIEGADIVSARVKITEEYE
jgi:dihydroneopterin aldolase